MQEGIWASMAAVWQGSLQKRVILHAVVKYISRLLLAKEGAVGLTVAKKRRWRVAVPAWAWLV